MNIGFIGVGHMASSILRALAKDESLCFLVNDHHEEKIASVSLDFPGRVYEATYRDILRGSSFLFLGVKPTDLGALLDEIKEVEGPILVSMAAGFSMSEILSIVGNRPLIRIMPNTPVLVGKGVTFATYHDVSENDKETFEKMMAYTGSLYEIEEEKMDAVSVLTGSTPAYLDYFLDALAKFGRNVGFTEKEATEYVLKMAEGTIALDLASEKTPLELGKEVCSPGGSTIEGVKVLLDKKMPETVIEAAEASYKKNKNMK